MDIMKYDLKRDYEPKFNHKNYDPSTCYKTPKKAQEKRNSKQLYPYGDPSKDYVVP